MSYLTTALAQTALPGGAVEVTIDPGLLRISKLDIIVSLGYAGGAIDRHFEDTIEELLLSLPGLCAIRAGYRVADVEKATEHCKGLYADGTFFTLGKIVTSQLKHSEKIAAFVCTIGSGMEDLSRRLFTDGDALGGHFADTIASAAAEKTAALLHDHIELVMAARKLHVTNRYSPGYCGWQVSEQKKLFSLFPAGFCGITVGESSLMTPVKSVSGLMGIGGMVSRTPYLCGRCGRKNCTYEAYAGARTRNAPSL